MSPHCDILVVLGDCVGSVDDDTGSEVKVRVPGVCRKRMAAFIPALLRKLPLGDTHDGVELPEDQERQRERRNECAGEGKGGDVRNEPDADAVALNEPLLTALEQPPGI